MPEVGTKRTNYEYQPDESDAQKKSRQDGDKVRLLVLGRYAGTLIGKGGENFIRLREQYSVKITGLSSRANERVIQLDGPRSECLGIVKELLPLCPVGRYPASNSKCSFEVNLLANTDAVGLLIGKGGTKIREITEETGTRLKVYPECLPNSNERVIALGGEDVEVLVQGVETVLGHLDAAPQRSKTIYFHPDKMNGKQLTTDLQGKNGSGAIINPMAGAQVDMIAQAVRDNSNIAALLVAQRNLKEQNGFDASFDFGSVKTVTTLTLSTEICGAIIGKGGNNIRYIKQVSGATIDSTKDDGGERTITINGTQDQVQVAEQLMAQCVRASKPGGQQQQQQPIQQQQQPFQQQQQQQQHPPLMGQQAGFDPYARGSSLVQPWD